MITGRQLSDPKSQIDALDGLRGLAVLLVFLSHASNRGLYLLPHANLEGVGKYGVYLFFVLSSFLLTLPFLRSAHINASFLINYGLRRVFRIYPLYILYLALGLVTTWALFRLPLEHPVPFPLDFREFWRHLFLQSGFGVTWSVAVEFKFYFLLPLLAIVYRVLCRTSMPVALLMTLLMAGIVEYIWPQDQYSQNDIRLGPYLATFLMGSLSATCYVSWQGNPRLHGRGYRRAFEVAGVLALLILTLMTPSLFGYLTDQPINRTYFHSFVWQQGVLFSILILSCLCGVGYLRRLFELPVLRYFGFVSFSLYLFHIVVLDEFVTSTLTTYLRGWGALIVSVVLSHCSWQVIEKPFARIVFSR